MTYGVLKGPVFGIRHLQTLLLYLLLCTVHITRLNVGLSVVAITSGPNPNYPKYDWTVKQKSYILSSFFWGNIWTQCLGAYFTRRYGGKIVMFVGTFGSGVLMALTPLFIYWGGWQAFAANRAVFGAFQGLIVPSIHQHIANWAPLQERTRLGALAYTGFDIGAVFAMLVTGLIATSPWGWPGISYVIAGICFAWCGLWLWLGANKPSESRLIGKAELEYISKSAPGQVEQSISVPWRAILKSPPVLALLFTRSAAIWGLTTLQTQLPSYLSGIMELDVKKNTWVSALPFIGMTAGSFICLLAADLLTRRKMLTLTQLRKTFNSIAFLVPATSLILIGFLDVKHEGLAILFMTLGNTFYVACTVGSALNGIDLSPNHAGVLMGIINTCCNLSGLFAPLLVGFIVTDEHSRTEWQIVFIVSALVYVSGACVYVKWGTTVTQPWNAADFLTRESPKADSEAQPHTDDQTT